MAIQVETETKNDNKLLYDNMGMELMTKYYNDSMSDIHDISHNYLNIIHEGWLIKESFWLHEERKRWVVLTTSNIIFTYKTKQNYVNPTESFNLNIYNRLESKTLIPNMFCIIDSNWEVRRFTAMNRNDKNIWCNIISKCLNKINKNEHKITADV